MPSSRRSEPKLRGRVALWLLGSVIGGAIVAAPDSGERLFSLSDSHGPSVLDLVGILILIASWLPLAVLLPRLWSSSGRGVATVSAALALAGMAGLIVTIGADLGWTWIVAVGALTLAQVLLIADGLRRPARPGVA